MKILAENDTKQYTVCPGDTFSVVYQETANVRIVKRDVLTTHEITEAMTIDRVAVAELEGDELKALGMSKALAGIVGTKSG